MNMTDLELNAWIWKYVFKMVEHKIDKTSDGVDVWERLYLPTSISPNEPYEILKNHWKLLYIPDFISSSEYSLELIKRCRVHCGDVCIETKFIDDDSFYNIRSSIGNSGWIEAHDKSLEKAIALFIYKIFSYKYPIGKYVYELI